jgi:hypothetical protein
MAWRLNLLHAPHLPGSEPDLDAVGVVSRCRQDVLHDAPGALPAPLVLLLRDAHLEPWSNVCTMLPVHVVLASFPFGSGRNSSSSEFTMQNTLGKNTPSGRERLVLDTVFPLLPLSCTPRLAYTVCGKAGNIDTDARALVLQR